MGRYGFREITMPFERFGKILLGLGLCTTPIGACASDQPPTNQQKCVVGTLDCDCYANGTCNVPLICSALARCEAQGSQGGASGSAGSENGGGTSTGGASAGMSGTGGSDGGTGNTATGGSDSGGGTDAGASGGTTSGSGGDTGGTTGGASGSAGAGMAGMTGGSAGANAGSGGSAGSCGDTSSDWQNCGACGRACRNPGVTCTTSPCCRDGECMPSFGACFDSSAGFTTCDQYCASIGETCVAAGCGSRTRLGWSIVDQTDCEAVTLPGASTAGACDVDIPFQIATTQLNRCCCTDTP